MLGQVAHLPSSLALYPDGEARSRYQAGFLKHSSSPARLLLLFRSSRSNKPFELNYLLIGLPVVVGLEMLTLVLNRLCVIFYCASILPLLAESVTSVVVKVRFVRVQLDCPGETLNRLLKITLSVK